MRALVFATREDDGSLLPFSSRTHPALLSVAGKPLLAYAVESIADAGIQDVTVVTPDSNQEFTCVLGNGKQWGINLKLVTVDDLITRYWDGQGGADDEWLVARGDILWDCPVPQFLEAARASTQSTVCAVATGRSFGLMLHRGRLTPQELIQLAEPAPTLFMGDVGKVPFDEREARFTWLRSLKDYHQANLDVAAGEFGGLVLSGHEVEPGIHCAKGSRWHRPSIKGRGVFIGPYCKLDKSVEIGGPAVLAGNAIIDRNVTLNRTVVLPDTYVGEYLDVSNCIIWGQQVVNVETGGMLNIIDRFLLSDIRRQLTRVTAALDVMERGSFPAPGRL